MASDQKTTQTTQESLRGLLARFDEIAQSMQGATTLAEAQPYLEQADALYQHGIAEIEKLERIANKLRESADTAIS